MPHLSSSLLPQLAVLLIKILLEIPIKHWIDNRIFLVLYNPKCLSARGTASLALALNNLIVTAQTQPVLAH